MKFIITGGSSGLGACLVEALSFRHDVYDWSLETGVDVTCERSISCALINLVSDQGVNEVDCLINCAGVNYINWHEDTPLGEWDRLMNTNARSMWLVTKILINSGQMANPSTICNIVSNASHIPMTNSAAYNASKGAAHILTLQMARELKKRHNITVFGVSPNKLHSTKMSEYIAGRVCELRGWTPEEATKYQLASLPAGEETDPSTLAEFVTFLLSSRQRHKFLNGCIIPYGA